MIEPEKPGSIPALVKLGFRKFRKPFWNESAYLEAQLAEGGYLGPWFTLVDPASDAALGATEPQRMHAQDVGMYETDWIGVK